MLMVLLADLEPGLAVAEVHALQDPRGLEGRDGAKNGGEAGAVDPLSDPGVQFVE